MADNDGLPLLLAIPRDLHDIGKGDGERQRFGLHHGIRQRGLPSVAKASQERIQRGIADGPVQADVREGRRARVDLLVTATRSIPRRALELPALRGWISPVDRTCPKMPEKPAPAAMTAPSATGSIAKCWRSSAVAASATAIDGNVSRSAPPIAERGRKCHLMTRTARIDPRRPGGPWIAAVFF
jgi:hypothetical protein